MPNDLHVLAYIRRPLYTGESLDDINRLEPQEDVGVGIHPYRRVSNEIPLNLDLHGGCSLEVYGVLIFDAPHKLTATSLYVGSTFTGVSETRWKGFGVLAYSETNQFSKHTHVLTDSEVVPEPDKNGRITLPFKMFLRTRENLPISFSSPSASIKYTINFKFINREKLSTSLHEFWLPVVICPAWTAAPPPEPAPLAAGDDGIRVVLDLEGDIQGNVSVKPVPSIADTTWLRPRILNNIMDPPGRNATPAYTEVDQHLEGGLPLSTRGSTASLRNLDGGPQRSLTSRSNSSLNLNAMKRLKAASRETLKIEESAIVPVQDDEPLPYSKEDPLLRVLLQPMSMENLTIASDELPPIPRCSSAASFTERHSVTSMGRPRLQQAVQKPTNPPAPFSGGAKKAQFILSPGGSLDSDSDSSDEEEAASSHVSATSSHTSSSLHHSTLHEDVATIKRNASHESTASIHSSSSHHHSILHEPVAVIKRNLSFFSKYGLTHYSEPSNSSSPPPSLRQSPSIDSQVLASGLPKRNLSIFAKHGPPSESTSTTPPSSLRRQQSPPPLEQQATIAGHPPTRNLSFFNKPGSHWSEGGSSTGGIRSQPPSSELKRNNSSFFSKTNPFSHSDAIAAADVPDLPLVRIVVPCTMAGPTSHLPVEITLQSLPFSYTVKSLEVTLTAVVKCYAMGQTHHDLIPLKTVLLEFTDADVLPLQRHVELEVPSAEEMGANGCGFRAPLVELSHWLTFTLNVESEWSGRAGAKAIAFDLGHVSIEMMR
ncbi:hypothetical protein HDU98_000775 [Podochytrium sp. JEL0797]|nr:hypothetical protein HDU98_000775 [Podochytrium sp. JEL0797]